LNKKGQLHIFKVFFIALFFIIIFGLLASQMGDSTETFTNQWGDDYPFLAWLINGINIWVFIGGLIGIVAMIIWGVGVTEQ